MRLLFAVLACGALLVSSTQAEVELITEPRPGEEFVLFRAASTVGSGRSADRKIDTDLAPEPVTARVHSSSGSGPLEMIVGARDVELLGDEEVQTEVSVVTSKNVHVESVTVKPAAASGVQLRQADDEESRIMARKIADIVKKPTTVTVKPNHEVAASEHIEVKSEAEIGVIVKTPILKSEHGDISVPPGKFQSSEETTSRAQAIISRSTELPPPLNVLSTGPRKASEDGGLHSKGVISDAPLVSAGSQPQASRINVKKGPNGQDYEYEYVYYYYDDDEANSTSTADLADVPDSKDEDEEITSTSSTTPVPVVTEKTTIASRRYLPTSVRPEPAETAAEESNIEEEDDEEPPSRTRGRVWSNGRGGQQQQQQHEETERVRGGGSSSGGRVRYTTIDRTRSAASEEEGQSTSTERVIANEVVPTRGAGSRFRGRTHTESPAVESVRGRTHTEAPATEAEEARLPHSTRFPPRQRSSATPGSDIPSRVAVRPSLELVDSSSFRTSGDLPSFPSVPGGPNAPVRFLGVTTEDASAESTTPSRRRGRPTTTTTTSTTSTEAPIPTTEVPSTEPPPSANSLAVEKAAYDLYAILQQAQDNIQENVVQEEEDEVETLENTTPEDTTTLAPSTTPSVPITTSTTPEPSTAAPVTTTTVASGRGRYRSRGGSSGNNNSQQRSRIRRPEINNAVPSSEAAAPATQEETSTVGRQRGRYGSTTGRRSTTPAPAREEETNENDAVAAVSTPKPRNRFRAGSRATVNKNTPAPTQASSASHINNHVRPSFPRRRNFPASSSTTTTQSSVEESEVVSSEDKVVSVAPPAVSKVPPKTAIKPRPTSRVIRPGGRNNLLRPSALTTATTPAPSTAAAAESSQESGVTSDTAPASEEQVAQAVPEVIDPQDEEAAVTTPVPNTLTRLRNRPRLRITERVPKPNSAQTSPTASPASRRQLGASLLLRKRPTPAPEVEPEAASVETETRDETEQVTSQEAAPAEQAPPTLVPAPVEPENRFSSLFKKRGRKPGLFPARHATVAASETA